MYIIHLSLVGVVALFGLLDTSPTTQKPFRRFQRYLIERAQPYTPDALGFFSQRGGSRDRDLEANEPASPFRGEMITTPRFRRLNRPPICRPHALVPKAKKPMRILTPKEAHSLPPITSHESSQSQHEHEEAQQEGHTQGSTETHAALSPVAVTAAVLVFSVLKTRGTEKRKRLIKRFAHGCQPAGLVPKARVQESPSAALAEVANTSAGINEAVVQMVTQGGITPEEAAQAVEDTKQEQLYDALAAQEVEYVDGRLPVAISFELPGRLVPVDSDVSLHELEAREREESLSASSSEEADDLRGLQSNAHERAPTGERRSHWVAGPEDAVTNWRERRLGERPRVALDGWRAVNAHLEQRSPERPRPIPRVPARLEPEWIRESQAQAHADL